MDEQSKTDDVLKGQIEADEAYFGGKRKGNRGRGARNKTIVFGILERNDEIVVKAKNFLQVLLCYRQWKGYNSLIFNGCKHLSVDQNVWQMYTTVVEEFCLAKHHEFEVHRDDALLIICLNN